MKQLFHEIHLAQPGIHLTITSLKRDNTNINVPMWFEKRIKFLEWHKHLEKQGEKNGNEIIHVCGNRKCE